MRRKINRSGSTSVVVADKSSGAFELKVVGVGTTDEVLRIAETVVTIEIACPENTVAKNSTSQRSGRRVAYLIETYDWLNL